MDFTVLLEVLRLPELRLVGSRGVYQHPKEDAALFLALSLSSSEAAAVQPVLSRPRHEDAR